MTADIFTRLFAGFAVLAVAAVVTPLLARKRRLAGIVNLALVSVSAVLLLTVAFEAVFGHGAHASLTLSLGPVAIPFLVDGFSGLFLAVIAFMAVMSAIYSIRYMDHYPEYGLGGYYLCYPLFILGMAALVTVDDLAVGFTLAWQIMTVASFFLVRFEHRKKENVRNAAKYLVLMEFAWVLVVGGAFFVDGYTFGEPLAATAAKLGGTSGLPLLGFFAFLLAGFGLKAGVFPLGQLWLPDAHSIAPSPVSALLSGVMLKTGIYGLMRTFLFMAPVANPAFDAGAWGLAIAAIGAVTLLVGTIQSMKQSDAKRLLAYSSIGQIGYIVLAIGAVLFLGASGPSALRALALVAAIGALYHVLNHAIFKGLLFLTSGSILYATGTKDLNKLGGLIKLMPVTAVVAGIASLSISGMPPFSGFASKWTIISSSLLAGEGTVALVLFGIVALFTSAVTLACYVKFFGMAFTSSGSEWNVREDGPRGPGLDARPQARPDGRLRSSRGSSPSFRSGSSWPSWDGPRASSSPTCWPGPAAPCPTRPGASAWRSSAGGRSPRPPRRWSSCSSSGRPWSSAPGSAVGRREGSRGPDLALRLPEPERRQPVRRPEHVRRPARPVPVGRRESGK